MPAKKWIHASNFLVLMELEEKKEKKKLHEPSGCCKDENDLNLHV